MVIKGMKKGKYQVRVVNFEGSDQGHKKVWKMRAFSESSPVNFGHEDGMQYE